jgi:peroxiredoxin (alkyl hydroperoxide reductase subunit C)
MSLLNTTVPDFSVKAYHAGAFKDVAAADLAGSWSVLFFYPADFSAVCPTELYDLQEHYAQFADLGVRIYSVSTDSHYSHQAWAESTPLIDQLEFPMLADHAQELSRALGVLIPETGVAERATFIIDHDRQIKAIEISDGPVARKADELVRKAKAAQFVAATGKIAPATWALPTASGQ